MSDRDGQQSEGSHGNVTVESLSMAVPVDAPEIAEVLDCDTGEYLYVREWISGWRYEKLVPQRGTIKERIDSDPRFRCSLCSVPVYLIANKQKHFFFRHRHEDGSCPAETRSPLSREEILARKYHGLRESEPHRRIKGWIARSLAADGNFSDIAVERQWRATDKPALRRQPDVQAMGPAGRVAFEVQLSTTFLDVVVARRSFYRNQGALLVWIMGHFDPNYRRLTTDDLFYANNSNFLVVDEETTALSERNGRFHVRCHHRRPRRDGDHLVDAWEERLVAFADLTCDTVGQRCFWFDYDGKAEAIRSEIERDRYERAAWADADLSGRLLGFWEARTPHGAMNDDARRDWGDLRRACAERGLSLPAGPDDDTSFAALMNAVASARAGRPVGWGFRQLVEVGHKIADAYPHHAVVFGHAVRHFGTAKVLEQQDGSRKWWRRAAAIRESLERGEPTYLPNRETLGLVGLLVPPLRERLERLLVKSEA